MSLLKGFHKPTFFFLPVKINWPTTCFTKNCLSMNESFCTSHSSFFFKTWNGLFFTGDLRSLQSYLMLSLSVSDAHNPQHEYFTGDLNLLHAAKCKISI